MFIVLRKRFRDITVTGLLSRVSTATLMRNIDRPIAVLSVRLSVRPSVCPSVRPSLTFRYCKK